ncbi:PAS domain-containing protein [Pedobacter metabolipauper]|uniref:histidine kinase n=1 Tax=Pedobacter metabolipauper TaxID=425513 RepID=A0A4R6STD8_9SPHI|nr:PAS domain-containing protein [Pedobacter metabolipauper]TDQ08216.1 PAS domain S-box-containing protein [Pedobacter metabolipauper]
MNNSDYLLNNEQLLEVFTLTKTATAIHVSEDAVIQTANDAMLRIWDKDKSVIGKSLADALPELREQPFIGLFKRVWNEGITISGNDTPADIAVDGKLQTFYFDFEYRAIKNDQGKTLCILHTATDVTDRFLKKEAIIHAREKEEALLREQEINEELAAANEELSAINEELQQTQENLYELNNELEDRISERTRDLSQANVELRYSELKINDILNQLPSPVVVLRGSTFIIEMVNQAILSFWNKSHSEVIGKPMLEVFPELAAQIFPTLWKKVLETGEPVFNRETPIYYAADDGTKRQHFVDYFYKPLTELDGTRTGVLATLIDVTHKIEANKQLEENQVSLQKLNEELSAINEEMTASNEELLVTNEALADSKESLVKKVNELAASEARFISMVTQAPVAITVLKTSDLIIDIVNERMLEIWGKTPDIQGKPLALAMPELEGQPFLQILSDVLNSGEPYYGSESKAQIVRNGELIQGYFNFICQPIKDDTGAVTSVLQVVNEITEQVDIRIELLKAEKMMDLAITAAKLGSWHIHPVTKELKYNAMLAKLFGYEGTENMTYAQAIGQVVEEHRDRITQEINNAINNGGDYDITYAQRRFNDNEVIWLRSLGKITPGDDGNLSLFSGFVMDITEMKKDEQRKNDFIGMVSHELKTPLTSLNGYIQMLMSKAKKSEDVFAISALDVAIKQVKKMTSMINGFLNISRLESGKILLNKSHFRLDELIQATAQESRLLDPGHTVTIFADQAVDVFADYDKISNVVSNLLSNAVKYSPNSHEIEVHCIVKKNLVEVSVKDYGIGIETEDLNRLFERFYRVESNNSISGFGIGLYLSAEIIDRHNGKIWAESEPDKGSTFYFTLPL